MGCYLVFTEVTLLKIFVNYGVVIKNVDQKLLKNGSFLSPNDQKSTKNWLDSRSHNGIIQTAAASDLGKMLVRKCIKLDIPVLNIIRRDEQAEELVKLGAKSELILN
jgi:hypothetical protein